MRIVSLLPSATEVACALGLEDPLVRGVELMDAIVSGTGPNHGTITDCGGVAHTTTAIMPSAAQR